MSKYRVKQNNRLSIIDESGNVGYHSKGDIIELDDNTAKVFADVLEDPIIGEDAAQRAAELHVEEVQAEAIKDEANRVSIESEKARRKALKAKRKDKSAGNISYT